MSATVTGGCRRPSDLVPVPRTTEYDLTMGMHMLKGIFGMLNIIERDGLDEVDCDVANIRANLVLAGEKIAKDITGRL